MPRRALDLSFATRAARTRLSMPLRLSGPGSARSTKASVWSWISPRAAKVQRPSGSVWRRQTRGAAPHRDEHRPDVRGRARGLTVWDLLLERMTSPSTLSIGESRRWRVYVDIRPVSKTGRYLKRWGRTSHLVQRQDLDKTTSNALAANSNSVFVLTTISA